MSDFNTCMGYNFLEQAPCEQSDKTSCDSVPGCKIYSSKPDSSLNYLNIPAGHFEKKTEKDEELYKYMLLNKQILENVIPVSYSSNSWPCRGQSVCNFFDLNPIIPTHIKEIDLASLPPNA